MSGVPDPQVLSRRQQILEFYARLQSGGPHALLGLSPEADAASARAAFVALAKRFHPDALGAAEEDLRDKAQAIFMEVSAAYDAVREALKRRPAVPTVRVPASQQEQPKAQAEQTTVTRERQSTTSERPSAPRPQSVASERPVATKQHVAQTQPVSERRAVSPASPRVVELPVTRPASPAAPPAPVSAARLRWREVEDAVREAEAHLREREPAAAIDVLHSVLRLAHDRQRGRVQLLLAQAYLAEPDKRRHALALLGEIVREQPANAEALALLGGVYLREGLLGRAESTLARALVADPGHPQARATLREVRELLSRRSAGEAESPRGSLFDRLLLMVR